MRSDSISASAFEIGPSCASKWREWTAPGFPGADFADGRLQPRVFRTLSGVNAHILNSATRMAPEAAALRRATFGQRLLRRVEDEAGIGAAADAPADDAKGARENARIPPGLRRRMVALAQTPPGRCAKMSKDAPSPPRGGETEPDMFPLFCPEA